MKYKHPLIAAIVSTDPSNCYDFLKFNCLNPECFKIATSREQLAGLPMNTPIIMVHYSPSYQYRDLRGFAEIRFKNVRLIDC